MIRTRRGSLGMGPILHPGIRVGVLVLFLVFPPLVPNGWGACQAHGQRRQSPPDTTPTLGLDQGLLSLDTPAFHLDLVQASQTVAALRPKADGGFDFTPSDWLERRDDDGYFHLGDLTLRLRQRESEGWKHYSTATARAPVEDLPVSPPSLAAAELGPTLPATIPLTVRRYWEARDGHLALRFELENRTGMPVEIGAVGIPLVFNNILQGRSLDEAHSVCSFSDPYIGGDAGYVQVTRLTGHGPVMLVVPLDGTPLEAYNPLLGDPTRRGVTFEGFYEWVAHSRAFMEEEWEEAEPWTPPTSATLAPGETRSYGLVFLLAAGPRSIESTLEAHGRPVAVGIPGYVLPADQEARLFLKSPFEIRSVEVEPSGALALTWSETNQGEWQAYDVRGLRWGRARVSVEYADGSRQLIHYTLSHPQAQVVADMGRFLTTESWYENPQDPFGRSPSVITYDYEERRQVTEDNRAWVAGLGDEGGGGAW